MRTYEHATDCSVRRQALSYTRSRFPSYRRGMAGTWTELREPQERLRWARLHMTPFARPTDAARSLNIRPVTYRTYEIPKSEGGRWPPLAEVQRIASKFGVSWAWLATGQGSPDDAKPAPIRIMVDEWAVEFEQIDPAKRDDAATAVRAVLEAFKRKAS